MGNKVKLGELLSTLTDYHANGAYQKLKENVELLDSPNFAVMIRTTNFEQEDFSNNVKYISKHAYEFLAKSKVYPNDIIMNKIANAGSSYLMPDLQVPVSLAMNLFLLRVDDTKANPIYVYIYLKINEAYVKSFANGSVTKTITKDAVRNLEIELPSRAIQDRIVDQFTCVNDKVTLNRQINQTLEHMAQALFKSWFVDFDPVVDNALDAGFFEHNSDLPEELLRRAEQRKIVRQRSDFTPLPAETRQLFPAAFEACDEPSLGLGGWVPQGWGISLAGDELVVKGGSTPSTANPDFWNDGEIHWTSPKDLSGSTEKVMLDTERKITAAGLQKITSGLLPIGSVLMSSRAPIGYLAITKIPVAVNQGYIAIPASKQLSQEYVLYWLNNSVEDIKSIAGGTTFAEISKRTFKSIPLIIPCNKVIISFSELVKGYLDKIAKNVMERSILEQLRDTLLPKLIAGELRLNDNDPAVDVDNND
ncbi:restriction endonuclease subunit S [Edwardsiella piscicida]|uniref:restriction endonuclease subunit S n=1 Tax=Edwardsiella piscicida TaxID=1263550 RepID=UPI001C63426A|nr:restriction endonuclease subunit S [Edwardsiella piscicida]UCQ19736.1 restriction endonuclease subunit S [Edwardsiella piscicida]